MSFWFVLTHKALPLLVMPVGLAACLVAWGALTKKRGPLLAALVLLWTCGMPLSGNGLMRLLENTHPASHLSELQSSDAIVVLGGMGVRRTALGDLQVNDAIDRFETGLTLLAAGRAPTIVLCHGPLRDGVSEGALLQSLAIRRGADSGQVKVAPEAVNTAAEAKVLRAMAEERGWRRLLLVTSAFHMPRAVLLFESEGLTVQPVPVDYRAEGCAWGSEDWNATCVLPEAESLWRCQLALRELLARAFYWAVLPTSAATESS